MMHVALFPTFPFSAPLAPFPLANLCVCLFLCTHLAFHFFISFSRRSFSLAHCRFVEQCRTIFVLNWNLFFVLELFLYLLWHWTYKRNGENAPAKWKRVYDRMSDWQWNAAPQWNQVSLVSHLWPQINCQFSVAPSSSLYWTLNVSVTEFTASYGSMVHKCNNAALRV